jgi:alpha-glucosidase
VHQQAGTVPRPEVAAPVHRWWRDAVIYQVHVRSSLDSAGDGIGDLDGVRAGLPYLRRLGVDGIWISPVHPSPQHDHGYDVADCCDVALVHADMQRQMIPGPAAGVVK